MHYAYPYVLNAEPEGGFSVSFPDIPEAHTQGDTEEEARVMAEDALVTALSFYTDSAQPVPRPSPARGMRLAYVPSLVAVKLALHDVMIKDQVSNVVLADRLGITEKAVRRLRDPLHRSHIGNVETALRALGRRLIVSECEVELSA